MTKKDKQHGGKFLLGAILGAAAGVFASKYVSAEIKKCDEDGEDLDDCECDCDCDCDCKCDCEKMHDCDECDFDNSIEEDKKPTEKNVAKSQKKATKTTKTSKK